MEWFKNIKARLDEYLKNGATGNPSVKRLIYHRASWCLMAVAYALGAACTYWIAKHGDLGSGATMALGAACATVATLAGVGYTKKEGRADASPTKPEGADGDQL